MPAMTASVPVSVKASSPKKTRSDCPEKTQTEPQEPKIRLTLLERVRTCPLMKRTVLANEVFGLRRTSKGGYLVLTDVNEKIIPRSEFEELIVNCRLFYDARDGCAPTDPASLQPSKPASTQSGRNASPQPDCILDVEMATDLQNVVGKDADFAYCLELAREALAADRVDVWNESLMMLKDKIFADTIENPRGYFTSVFRKRMERPAVSTSGLHPSHLPYVPQWETQTPAKIRGESEGSSAAEDTDVVNPRLMQTEAQREINKKGGQKLMAVISSAERKARARGRA